MLFIMITAINARTVRVGIYDNKPIVYNTDSKPQGIFVDIMDEIADKEGWHIEYVFSDWSTCMKLLGKDSIDVLVDIAYTKERAQQLDFSSISVLTNWGQLYVSPNIEFGEIADLEGKTVAGVKDDIYTESFRTMLSSFGIKVKFLEVSDYYKVLKSIDNKSADAGVVNRLFGLQFAEVFHAEDTSFIFRHTELRFASKKGKHKDILQAIDENLAQFKNDRTSIYYKTLQTNLNLNFNKDQKPTIEELLVYISSILLLLTFMLLWLRKVLQRNRAKMIKRGIALIDSREDFFFLSDHMANGIILMSTNRKITYANTNICKMLGLSEEELLEKNINDYIDTKLKEIDASNKAKLTDTYVITWKITERTITTNVIEKYILDETGLIVGSILLVTNSSAIDKLKEELHEIDTIYQSLLNYSTESVVITNKNGNILTINQNLLNLLEYESKEKFLTYVSNVYDMFTKDTVKEVLHGISMKFESCDCFETSAELLDKNGCALRVNLRVLNVAKSGTFSNQMIFLIHHRDLLISKGSADTRLLVNQNSSYILVDTELMIKKISSSLISTKDIDVLGKYFFDVYKLESSITESNIKQNVEKGNDLIVPISKPDSDAPIDYYAYFNTQGNEVFVYLMPKVRAQQATKLLYNTMIDAFDLCTEAVIAFDLEGKKCYRNIVSESIFPQIGFQSPDELLEIVVEEDQSKLKSALEMLMHKGFSNSIEIRINPKVIASWLHISFLRIKKGNNYVLIMLINDITERKRREIFLDNEREEFFAIIQSMDDIILHTNAIGNVLFANKTAKEILGISSNYKGIINDLLEVKDEETKQTIELLNKSVIGDKKRLDIYSANFYAKQAKTNYIAEVSVFPHPATIREENGYLIIIHNVTQKYKIQEITEKNKRLESMGILINRLANDYNNILTAIMGHISLLKRMPEMSSKAQDRIQKAEEAAKKATQLTRSLFLIDQPEQLHFDEIDVEKLISLDTKTDHLSISTIKDIDKDIWCIIGDHEQLKQAINSIITNAIESVKEDGLLTIKCANIEFELNTGFPYIPGKYVKITIKDNGIGIAVAIIDKCIEPYFTTKKSNKGLGLTIAYQIIRAHKGYLNIESVEGIGTECTILLPAQDINMTTDKEFIIDPNDYTLLFMDDEQLVREITQDYLNIYGYNVLLATRGEEVISMYTKALHEGKKIDLLILDLIVTEGLGAKETLEVLRTIDPDVTAMIVTGLKTDPVLKNYEKLGFKAAVLKPFDFEAMNKIIQRILRVK